MSATDSPLTSESSPRRSVKGANQSRRLDWLVGLLAAWLALIVVCYGILFIADPPSDPLVVLVVAVVPWDALMAFWLWVNRAELELSPERIVIRSRWRRVMRAQPRDLMLPADAAIVSDRALVRVGGWSAGMWTLQRISALTEEAGVPLVVRRQQTPKAIRKRLLIMFAVTIPLSIAGIVWLRTLSIASVEMLSGVLAALGSLAFFAMLWWRFRMERTVPGQAVEPIEGL